MERSLTDEEINDLQVLHWGLFIVIDLFISLMFNSLKKKYIKNLKFWLQWNVREQVQSKLNVVLRWELLRQLIQ